MQLISVLLRLLKHPLGSRNKWRTFVRFVKWQVLTRINPRPIVYRFTEKSVLVIERGMTGATGNYYCGLQEFDDMAFLLHVLREQDLVGDIGANIGSYTVLSSAHCGARTIFFEPVPISYKRLIRNVEANKIQDKVQGHNAAVGSKPGTLRFTQTSDMMNHVALEGETNTIDVPVVTLDGVLAGGECPFLLKIDVEGFETEVINGATTTLARPELKAIIMEIKGTGARYGYDEQQLHNRLVSFGFAPYRYDGFTRSLIELDTYKGDHNTIYIREPEMIRARISSAPYISIHGVSI